MAVWIAEWMPAVVLVWAFCVLVVTWKSAGEGHEDARVYRSLAIWIAALMLLPAAGYSLVAHFSKYGRPECLPRFSWDDAASVAAGCVWVSSWIGLLAFLTIGPAPRLITCRSCRRPQAAAQGPDFGRRLQSPHA